METWLIILGALALGGLGILWDYFKPARFRTSYRNVSTRYDSGGVGHSGPSGSDGCDGGSD